MTGRNVPGRLFNAIGRNLGIGAGLFSDFGRGQCVFYADDVGHEVAAVKVAKSSVLPGF